MPPPMVSEVPEFELDVDEQNVSEHADLKKSGSESAHRQPPHRSVWSVGRVTSKADSSIEYLMNFMNMINIIYVVRTFVLGRQAQWRLFQQALIIQVHPSLRPPLNAQLLVWPSLKMAP